MLNLSVEPATQDRHTQEAFLPSMAPCPREAIMQGPKIALDNIRIYPRLPAAQLSTTQEIHTFNQPPQASSSPTDLNTDPTLIKSTILSTNKSK